MSLNAKQEMFCKEYLKDLNATQAAIRAGYSERTAYSTGQRLLKHVEINARVKELKAKRAEELELDAYWVLKRLMDISNRSMQAEPVLEWDEDSHSMVHRGEYKFDSVGATKATELIGKHIGVFLSPREQALAQLRIEQMKRDIEIKEKERDLKQLEIDRIKNPNAVEEMNDDGFIEALNHEAADVWDEEDRDE